MGAAPGGKNRVMWTSLREEPVLASAAHTIRSCLTLLVRQVQTTCLASLGQASEQCRVSRCCHSCLIIAVAYVRTTGITASVVERMEATLKQDVLREIRSGEGKLLLHDEVETKPGIYEIIPIWEAVEESDVMTPKELYKMVTDEAYNVDYQRVAVVSCFAETYPDITDRRASSFACYFAGDRTKSSHWTRRWIGLCVGDILMGRVVLIDQVQLPDG
jgi:hypothetical protein